MLRLRSVVPGRSCRTNLGSPWRRHTQPRPIAALSATSLDRERRQTTPECRRGRYRPRRSKWTRGNR
ncbi:hypothetical protein VZT92_023121 [Zoarces viviparus]|uniref:Uncharacterized protein n=1 Tax=Zoarces viviparus TaxID=48416 RepID=A0AAW1E6A4_ZOAVI